MKHNKVYIWLSFDFFMDQGNQFARLAANEREYRAACKKSGIEGSQKRLQGYFDLVDQLSEYMKSEGILRLPVHGSSADISKAHITADGRIVATHYRKPRILGRTEERQYHLKDLSEVLEFLGECEGATHLSGVSENALERARGFVDGTVKLNIC